LHQAADSTPGFFQVVVNNFTNIPHSATKRTFWHAFQALTIAALMPFGLGIAIADLDFPGLQQQLIARFGPARISLLQDWQTQLEATKKLSEEEKLKRLNDFFNRNIAFDEDLTVWNQSDYWATPLETIGRGRGDCEDFSIVKYYSLRQAGVPVSKMRLIYVKARQGGNQRAHMVLAYYASPSAEPLVLDNLDPVIKPASKRPDLVPVFSFNSQGIYAGIAGNAAASTGGTGKLSRWEDLMHRARNEGFK